MSQTTMPDGMTLDCPPVLHLAVPRFEVTFHDLVDSGCIGPDTIKPFEDALNEKSKTHVLYRLTFVADGRAAVCVWQEKAPQTDLTDVVTGLEEVRQAIMDARYGR